MAEVATSDATRRPQLQWEMGKCCSVAACSHDTPCCCKRATCNGCSNCNTFSCHFLSLSLCFAPRWSNRMPQRPSNRHDPPCHRPANCNTQVASWSSRLPFANADFIFLFLIFHSASFSFFLLLSVKTGFSFSSLVFFFFATAFAVFPRRAYLFPNDRHVSICLCHKVATSLPPGGCYIDSSLDRGAWIGATRQAERELAERRRRC